MKLKLIAASTLALGLGLPAAFAASNDNVSATDKMQAVASQNQDHSVIVDKDVRSGWFNRVTVTGKVYVDAGFASRTPIGGVKKDAYYFYGDPSSTSEVNLAQAAVFADANVNDWSQLHLGLTADDINDSADIKVSEAYLQLAKFDESPFYVKAGRMYAPFGSYSHNVIVDSYTKVLTKTRADALLVGYVDASGMYGNAYIFNGAPKSEETTKKRLNNFGLTLGYDGTYQSVGFGVKADYINNIQDTEAFKNELFFGEYNKRVGGLALSADVKSGDFDANIRYVRALSELDSVFFKNENAQPWAAGVEVGYSFDVMDGRTSRVYGGYQRTDEAVNLDLGKSRWELGYAVDAWKNTQVGIQYDYSKDYDESEGGSDNNVSVLTARLAVNFA